MPAPPKPTPPHRWYQFSLARMFLCTTLVSVLVAAWAGLTRPGDAAPLGFYVMIVAAPMAMAILLSLLQAVVRYWARRR